MTYREHIEALAAELDVRVSIFEDPSGPHTALWMVRPEFRALVSDEEQAAGFVQDGMASLVFREILFFGWLPETERTAYVGCLHELGHIATLPALGPPPACREAERVWTHDTELAAWQWAAQWLTEDTLEAAIQTSRFSLATYGFDPAEVEELHDLMRAAASASRSAGLQAAA